VGRYRCADTSPILTDCLWFLRTALRVVRGTQRIPICMRWFLLSDSRVASVLGPDVTGACDVVSVTRPSPCARLPHYFLHRYNLLFCFCLCVSLSVQFVWMFLLSCMVYHECMCLISILYTYLFSIMTSSISEGFMTWYDLQTGKYNIILLTHNFACRSEWVWNLVSNIKGGT
jgi:hypothetical protein